MKELFKEPIAEVITFEKEVFLNGSNGDGDTETPGEGFDDW